MVKKEIFGLLSDGRPVHKFTITNSAGEFVELFDFGACLHSAFVLDREDKLGDVLLGVTEAAELEKRSLEGFVVGRVANRIAYGKCIIDGKEVQLETNKRDGNFLHSESGNYAFRMFSGSFEPNGDTVTFRMKDMGGGGFTVPVDVEISYTFTDDHCLRLHYIMIPEDTTLLCPTNHAYFNLGNYGNVRNHYLQVFSENLAKKGPSGAPEGGLLNVADTPADFRKPRLLGEALDSDPDHRFFGKNVEFDDFYVIPGEGMRQFAAYYAPETGRCMEVWSDMDSLILFTPSKCAEKKPKYDGLHYPKFGAVCMETQFVPNAINCPEFRAPLFRKGEKLDTVTEYRFLVRKK